MVKRAPAGITYLLTLLLSLHVCYGGSIKYQFQPPDNSDTDVVITPNLPNDFFRSQVIVTDFSPVSDHHLNQLFTYIIEISGAELCQTVTIVGLEYCYRENGGQEGRIKTHFDFFTMQNQSPDVLVSSFAVSASSEVVRGNCSNIPSRSTVVCCSYQPLLSPPELIDVTHFGITNIQQFPTLLRLPDPDTATYFVKSKTTSNIPVPQTPDLRTFLTREGHVPSLRLYFKCPPSNLTQGTPSGSDTSSATDTSSTTDNPMNLSADSGHFNLTQILIYAGIAAGCFLFAVVTLAVALIVVAGLSREKKKKTLKSSNMPAPQDKDVYNTLDTIKPLNNPDRYSTLNHEWLPNSAYSSNTQIGSRELQNTQQQVRQFRPQGVSRYSTTRVSSDVYYSTVKPKTPPRCADYSIQSNIAYHNNASPAEQDVEPQYSNSNADDSETDQNTHNTQYYAVPKYADSLTEQETNC